MLRNSFSHCEVRTIRFSLFFSRCFRTKLNKTRIEEWTRCEKQTKSTRIAPKWMSVIRYCLLRSLCLTTSNIHDRHPHSFQYKKQITTTEHETLKDDQCENERGERENEHICLHLVTIRCQDTSDSLRAHGIHVYCFVHKSINKRANNIQS